MKKILLLVFIITGHLFSQGDYEANKQNKSEFINFLNTLTEKEINELKIQLITITPATTVTTAFGHSALRVFIGKQFDARDYYIDFGEYDESAGFIWRFLKGEAKFYITVRNMGATYNMWDTTGRGMFASEFIFTSDQKKLFIKTLIEFIETYKNGYFYDNFSSNCVTYIRDLIGKIYGVPLKLETEKNKRTWRSRVIPYSNKIFWLRIEEKLLLDHDTDKERNPTELIYLPYDLLTSLEDSKLVKDKELLHRDFWKLPEGFDYSGNLMLLLFGFAVFSQIPLYFNSPSIRRKGEVIFGLISGIGGTFALIVVLFTSFPFMNETIMPLVFTPIDFFLVRKNKPSTKILSWIVIARIIMILTALFLRLTVFKQSIELSLFFAVLFFSLYSWNFYKQNKQLQAA